MHAVGIGIGIVVGRGIAVGIGRGIAVVVGRGIVVVGIYFGLVTSSFISHPN